jgi:glutathione S-transferase
MCFDVCYRQIVHGGRANDNRGDCRGRRHAAAPALRCRREKQRNCAMLRWTALVTVVAVLVYFSTTVFVSRARLKYGIAPPATVGNADFERVFRVQMNSLEWMPIFLPLLWLFGFYVSDIGAAVVGLVWSAGRVAYIMGYSKAVAGRGLGFGIQAIACFVLLLGALGGIVAAFAHNG